MSHQALILTFSRLQATNISAGTQVLDAGTGSGGKMQRVIAEGCSRLVRVFFFLMEDAPKGRPLDNTAFYQPKVFLKVQMFFYKRLLFDARVVFQLLLAVEMVRNTATKSLPDLMEDLVTLRFFSREDMSIRGLEPETKKNSRFVKGDPRGSQ